MLIQYLWPVAFTAALVLGGCHQATSTGSSSEVDAGRALTLPPGLAGGVPNGAMHGSVSENSCPPNPTEALTLGTALSQTLLRSPQLAQYSFEFRSADALVLQAGYRPNPEIFLGTEDVGRTNARGGQTAQTTLTFSQVVELGGKRAGRIGLARATAELVGWDYEAKRLDILAQAANRFVDVIAAQNKRVLAAEMRLVEQQFFSVVRDRATAGDIPTLEIQRAQVTLSDSQIALQQADRNLLEARVRLAAVWGSREQCFRQALGNLDTGLRQPPDLDGLLRAVEHNPDLARWAAEIARRQAQFNVERSKNTPDITLQAGPRAYSRGGSSFVGGIGITLPTFGLNGGSLLSAQAQLDKGRLEQETAEVQVVAALREAHARLSTAYSNAQILEHDVLPAAGTAFDGVSTGYRMGKFGLLDVLTARRSLFDARSRLVDAQADYQQALTDIQRLTGQATKTTSREDDTPLRGKQP